MSIICPVCIEPLVISAESQVVSSPCGHVFHNPCLTSWLKEKATCPTCRTKVKDSGVKRLYLEFGTLSNGHSDEVAPYVCQVESLSFELKMMKSEAKNYKDKSLKDEEVKRALRAEVTKLENKARHLKCDYRDAVNALESKRTEVKSLRESLQEVDKLKEDLEHYKKLDVIIHGTSDMANNVLKSSDMDPENLVMLVSSFKKSYEDAKTSILKKDDTIHRLTVDAINHRTKIDALKSQISTLERVVETYKKTSHNVPRGTPYSHNNSASQLSPEPVPSSSRTPDVPTPTFRPTQTFKKIAMKRKSDTSPILDRKIKIVSSRLKKPQNDN